MDETLLDLCFSEDYGRSKESFVKKFCPSDFGYQDSCKDGDFKFDSAKCLACWGRKVNK
jgi:hypothetical protein